MAQIPDSGPAFDLTTILTGVGTVLASIASAYAVVRKSKADNKVVDQSTAQSTVQSTLTAMSTVIEGLTRELARKDTELDEIRTELAAERKALAILERQNTELENKIIRLEEHVRSKGEQIDVLGLKIQSMEGKGK